jgi:hypothetical protein
MLRENNNFIKKIIPFLIGLIILATLFYFVKIENIVEALSNTNLFYFFLAAIFYLCDQFFATLKLKQVSSLNFFQLFLSHQGGMFLSQITPSRAGYLFAGYSIAKKEKKSISEVFGLISLIQGIMISVKIFSITLAIFYFSFYFAIPNYVYFSFLVPILILIAIIFILYCKTSKNFLSKIPFFNRGVKYLELMQQSVKKVDKKIAIKLVILDLLGWIFFGIQFFFLIKALGFDLSFWVCLMMQPLISAFTFIPISPSGLGVAESEGAILFDMLGLQYGIGVAFLFLFRINSIFVDSIGLIDLKTIKLPKKFQFLS